MNDSHLGSIAQIKGFIKVARDISFQGSSRKEKYEWITEVLTRFKYFSLGKKDKSTIKTYLLTMTGFSDAQMTRLIKKKKQCGRIVANSNARHCFPKKYTPDDVAHLAATDLAHSRLSGPATKRIMVREHDTFHHEQFARLKHISVSHLYNLRGRRQYLSKTKFFTRTSPTPSLIGERHKPSPEGKPGFLRVDTVHQGDLEYEKGVYHLNIVDEVTQWEMVGAVEGISEFFLAPLLEDLLAQFPFHLLEFHSDNGSEYVNQIVARILNALLIRQTKSRPRHCNDNALVEGKNGAVIRKHMGYIHIPRTHALTINNFYQTHFNPYLNYHRPCGFATVSTDEKGKQKKVYDMYATPYEKLRSLPDACQYLKEGIAFAALDKISLEKSDNECAALMQKAKQTLFTTFKN